MDSLPKAERIEVIDMIVTERVARVYSYCIHRNHILITGQLGQVFWMFFADDLKLIRIRAKKFACVFILEIRNLVGGKER